MVEISVILTTYNSPWTSIEKTLNSILKQKNINIEIIITDDGSRINYFDKIENLMSEYKFSKYLLLTAEKNEGTVKNQYKGVLKASGKYIKDISPGDALYDENTLNKWYHWMEENQIIVSFGSAVYYHINKKNIYILEKHHNPIDMSCYHPRYQAGKARFNYMVGQDYALGAAFCTKTELMKKYLNLLIDRIIYLEDFMYVLMVANNIPIRYYPDKVIWYEYGSGISTKNSSKWRKILDHEQTIGQKLILSSLNAHNIFYYKMKLMYIIRKIAGEQFWGNQIVRVGKCILFPRKATRLFAYKLLYKYKIYSSIKAQSMNNGSAYYQITERGR